MQQIYPVPGPGGGGGEDRPSLLGRLYAYPEAAASRPWVRANMITSTDGAITVSGRSGGLGGPADRELFQIQRSLADVILVGSGTVRAEGYGPVPPEAMTAALRAGRPATPPIAVVTGRLDLDPESPLMAQAPADARTIVLTTQAAPPDARAALARHARVITAGAATVDADRAVTALADLGYPRVLAEGGPGLLAQLAAAGRLDELCLTISPVLAGGPAGRLLAPRPPLPGVTELRLGQVLTEDGFLFCRYLRA